MTKKPVPSGIPIEKDSWEYRENTSKDGSRRFPLKILVGRIGKKDIRTRSYYHEQNVVTLWGAHPMNANEKMFPGPVV